MLRNLPTYVFFAFFTFTKGFTTYIFPHAQIQRVVCLKPFHADFRGVPGRHEALRLQWSTREPWPRSASTSTWLRCGRPARAPADVADELRLAPRRGLVPAAVPAGEL